MGKGKLSIKHELRSDLIQVDELKDVSYEIYMYMV